MAEYYCRILLLKRTVNIDSVPEVPLWFRHHLVQNKSAIQIERAQERSQLLDACGADNSRMNLMLSSPMVFFQAWYYCITPTLSPIKIQHGLTRHGKTKRVTSWWLTPFTQTAVQRIFFRRFGSLVVADTYDISTDNDISVAAVGCMLSVTDVTYRLNRHGGSQVVRADPANIGRRSGGG